jgi:5-(carboxyamino)imidazole ribonucleotide synthase
MTNNTIHADSPRIPLLFPPATIGIVGGGQLGRMIAFEAKRMGYRVIVLDPKLDAPAGQVVDEQILADYGDLDALRDLASRCDVLTYEFEHIDAEALRILENEGARIYPQTKTLKRIKNKFVQKSILKANGIPVPDFMCISDMDDMLAAFSTFGGKLFLKSCQDGYDGKGNRCVTDERDIIDAYKAFEGQDMMAEAFVAFEREVSIIVAKNASSEVYYPISDNIHSSSILISSVVPASVSEQTHAKVVAIAGEILKLLDDYGVFCIEFFIGQGGEVYVNEIAPRPHNSGHYTIEACATSQFEQLVRVICGLPLGAPDLRMPCAMTNILGDDDVSGPYRLAGLEALMNLPETHLHLYGKPEAGALKKLGHITALAPTADASLEKATQALGALRLVPAY